MELQQTTGEGQALLEASVRKGGSAQPGREPRGGSALLEKQAKGPSLRSKDSNKPSKSLISEFLVSKRTNYHCGSVIVVYFRVASDADRNNAEGESGLRDGGNRRDRRGGLLTARLAMSTFAHQPPGGLLHQHSSNHLSTAAAWLSAAC